jgi:hypothetical protein
MATLPAPAQPDLRAYIVYDELPAGCISHVVREASCPLLRQGETVVVDPTDRQIATGDLFVIEYGRDGANGPSRKLVEFRQKTLCVANDEGVFRDQPMWVGLLYGEMRPMVSGLKSRPVRWTDGPCKVSDPTYFAERLVGRVVGILEASFVEPMRRAA